MLATDRGGIGLSIMLHIYIQTFLHGATHHAVMDFQIVADRQMPKVRAGRSTGLDGQAISTMRGVSRSGCHVPIGRERSRYFSIPR